MLQWRIKLVLTLFMLVIACENPIQTKSADSTWRRISYFESNSVNGVVIHSDTMISDLSSIPEIVRLCRESLYVCSGDSFGSNSQGVRGEYLIDADTLWPVNSAGVRHLNVKFTGINADTLFRLDTFPDQYDNERQVWIRECKAYSKYVRFFTETFPPVEWGTVEWIDF